MNSEKTREIIKKKEVELKELFEKFDNIIKQNPEDFTGLDEIRHRAIELSEDLEKAKKESNDYSLFSSIISDFYVLERSIDEALGL